MKDPQGMMGHAHGHKIVLCVESVLGSFDTPALDYCRLRRLFLQPTKSYSISQQTSQAHKYIMC